MALVASQTIARMAYSAGSEDDHGERAESWADAVDVDVYAIYPASVNEPFDNAREANESDLTVLLPASSGFVRKDRAVVSGEVFEVVGDLERFTLGHNGYTPGDRLNLKRVEG